MKLEDIRWQSLEDNNADRPSNHEKNDGDISSSTPSFVGLKGASGSSGQQVCIFRLHQTQISNFGTNSSCSTKGKIKRLDKFTLNLSS